MHGLLLINNLPCINKNNKIEIMMHNSKLFTNFITYATTPENHTIIFYGTVFLKYNELGEVRFSENPTKVYENDNLFILAKN
jgi:uncharacterized membrane protein YobD (UPF0266 family)